MNLPMLKILLVLIISASSLQSQDCINKNAVNFTKTKLEYEKTFNVESDGNEINIFNADTISEIYNPLRNYKISFNENGKVDTIIVNLIDMSSFGFYSTDDYIEYCRNYFSYYYSCITKLISRLNTISIEPQTWCQDSYKFELKYKLGKHTNIISFKIYLK